MLSLPLEIGCFLTHAVAAKRELQRLGPDFRGFVRWCAAFMKSVKWSERMAWEKISRRISLMRSCVESRIFLWGRRHLASGMTVGLPPFP